LVFPLDLPEKRPGRSRAESLDGETSGGQTYVQVAGLDVGDGHDHARSNRGTSPRRHGNQVENGRYESGRGTHVGGCVVGSSLGNSCPSSRNIALPDPNCVSTDVDPGVSGKDGLTGRPAVRRLMTAAIAGPSADQH